MKYIRLFWPEYQKYQDYDGFDNNAIYDCEENSYFVKQDWIENIEGRL